MKRLADPRAKIYTEIKTTAQETITRTYPVFRQLNLITTCLQVIIGALRRNHLLDDNDEQKLEKTLDTWKRIETIRTTSDQLEIAVNNKQLININKEMEKKWPL